MTVKKITDLVHHIPDYRSFKESEELIATSTLLGVEIELEDCPLETLTESTLYWHVGYDDSLRGDNAVEVRFTSPLGSFDTVKALRELENFIITSDITPIISYRTSTHIHIDIRTLNTKQLLNFILLVIFMEPVLFNYCRQYRSISPFSLPITTKQQSINTTINRSSTYTEPETNIIKSILKYFIDSVRYAGINFASISKFGSVEFRMLEGCYKVDKLLPWINILLSLYEKSIAYDSPKAMIADIHKYGFDKFSKHVLPEDYDLSLTCELRGQMKEGLLICKELLHATELNLVEWDILKLVNKLNSEEN